MIGLFDALKIGAGIIIGAALIVAPAYLKGKGAAEAEAKTAALEKTIEIIQSREITNAEITDSDAAALCAHFGLRDDDATECMRRVGQAHSDAGNGGLRHDE